MRHFCWIAVLVTGCADAGTADGQAAAIFREINIAPYGRVALGQPLAQRASVAHRLGPNLFWLKPALGSFADTDSILALTDSTGQVRALTFVYKPGEDYDGDVADYTRMLGKPFERVDVDSAQVRVERAVWQDAATRFTLERLRGPGTEARVRSMMVDRNAKP